MRLWRWIEAYAANDDPLAAASNLIALVVVSNQPFYPLYVYWIVGEGVGPTFYTFFSTPFFFAVPAVSRLSPIAGRMLLPLTGIANTIFCAKLFGVESGVELFLLPCVAIAMLSFRRSERIAAFALVGLAFLIFMESQGHYGRAIFPDTPEAYARFLRLNAFSVGTLTAFVGLTFVNAFERIAKRG